MADRYVRSSDGSDADSGATWALAKATAAGVAAIDTAGDRLFFSSSHNESTAGAIVLAVAGTASSPSQLLSVSDAAEPPTTISRGATIATTGANSHITLSGSFHARGLDFIAGDGGNNAQIRLADVTTNDQTYRDCTFTIRGTSLSNQIYVTNFTISVQCRWIDNWVKFSHDRHTISSRSGSFAWDGGGVYGTANGGVSPLILFKGASGSGDGNMLISGLDLSQLDSAFSLFSGANLHAIIRNSRLPASWSGELYTGTRNSGSRVEMHNCDSGGTNYRIWVADYTADLTQETTIVRTGGASDGTTPLSWKVVTTSSCNFLSGKFPTPEIVVWNETIGSPLTATIEIVHDSLTALKDDEIWLEVQYLGTSGYPIGSFVSDSKADVLASAAAQTSSAETWTTTGLANPNKQKLSVTFTPQEKGYLQAKVYMGKASYTVYVDPKLVVS